jgi:hypothetical protein
MEFGLERGALDTYLRAARNLARPKRTFAKFDQN